jgi:outer membrane beta-barrel protein
MTLIPRFFRTILPVLALVATAVDARELDAKDQEPVIQPEVERRTVTVPQLHARDIELAPFVGFLDVENFGTSLVYGARIGYHFTEDIFLEATYARSEVTDTAFRSLGISVFTEETSPLTYYHLSTGFNLFPGEIFLGKGRARYSYVYVVGGIGVTSFDVLDNVSYNFGFGMRVVPWNWLSVRIEVRDHIFESDLLGSNKMTNNIEATFGLSLIF